MRFTRISAFAALGLALAAGQLHAQAVPVRTGEHADFTRIVVPIPQGQDWHIVQGGRILRLVVDGVVPEFDLSRSFDLIPRTRLSDMRSSEDGLVLTLACDCEVVATQDVPPFVVIDISFPAPSPAPPPPTAPRPPSRPLSLEHLRSPAPNPTARTAGQRLARELTGQVASPPQPDLHPLHRHLPQTPPMINDTGALMVETDPLREALASDVAHAIADAVGHGLLRPSSTLPELKSAPDRSATEVMTDQIALIDAVGLARGATPKTAPASQSRDCPDPRLSDPANWDDLVNAGHVRGTIPRLSATIYSELDMPDVAEIQRAALSWLALGFGAEARIILSLVAQTGADAEFLIALSFLVDLDPLPPQHRQALLGPCPQTPGLWAFLAAAGDASPANTPVPGEGLKSTFGALPAPLRLQLGPQLIRLLVATGHTAQAHAIADMLARISETPSTALRIAFADLELDRPNGPHWASVERMLLDDDTVEGVIFVLQQRIGDGTVPEYSLLDQGQMHLAAHRGTETGQTLAVLLAQLLAQSLRFEDAFALMHSRDAALPADKKAALSAQLLEKLVQDGDDTQFIINVFAQRPWQDALEAGLAQRISSRLALLGFDEQAQLMRNSVSAHASTPDDQQALRQDAPDAATPDDNAPPAMARGITASGTPQPSSGPISGAEGTAQSTAPPAAPLSTRIETLAPEQGSGESDEAENGLLEAARDTLDASARLRSRLEQLLQPPDALIDDNR